jgi:hypothetical protein
MVRLVEAELLDRLPATDPRAIQARRDLRKINGWMGHVRTIGRTLSHLFADRTPQSIVELGAGDGTLLLKLAKRFSPRWKPSRIVLVDRQPAVGPETRAAFEALGWDVEYAQADVFDWLEQSRRHPVDVTLTTLFLHHFAGDDLRRLLDRAAAQTRLFVACEPRRSAVALGATRLLRLIGCNHVTRHDARVSVRAGFTGHELSAVWPAGEQWHLEERRAQPFTHYFVAQKAGSSS